jgi:hypothetical protein
VHGPFLLQRPVRVLNRVRVDLQFGRQFSDGGEGFARLQNSHRNAAPDFVGDLPEYRPRIGGVDVN